MFFLETKPSESDLEDILLELTTNYCSQSWLRHWLNGIWTSRRTVKMGKLPKFLPFWLGHNFAWFLSFLVNRTSDGFEIWNTFFLPHLYFLSLFLVLPKRCFYSTFFWLDIFPINFLKLVKLLSSQFKNLLNFS